MIKRLFKMKSHWGHEAMNERHRLLNQEKLPVVEVNVKRLLCAIVPHV
ncbi:hypothetical protein [Oceanobacillus senegalensis]|nr:hypothetical protein [Oceanobacillus senegalensis]